MTRNRGLCAQVRAFTHTHSSNPAQGPTPTKVILIKKGPEVEAISQLPSSPVLSTTRTLTLTHPYFQRVSIPLPARRGVPQEKQPHPVSPLPVTPKAGVATDPLAQKLSGQVRSLPMCQLPDTPAALSPTHSSPPHEWLHPPSLLQPPLSDGPSGDPCPPATLGRNPRPLRGTLPGRGRSGHDLMSKMVGTTQTPDPAPLGKPSMGPRPSPFLNMRNGGPESSQG